MGLKKHEELDCVGLGQGEEFEFYSGSKRMSLKGFLSINIFNSVL